MFYQQANTKRTDFCGVLDVDRLMQGKRRNSWWRCILEDRKGAV